MFTIIVSMSFQNKKILTVNPAYSNEFSQWQSQHQEGSSKIIHKIQYVLTSLQNTKWLSKQDWKENHKQKQTKKLSLTYRGNVYKAWYECNCAADESYLPIGEILESVRDNRHNGTLVGYGTAQTKDP